MNLDDQLRRLTPRQKDCLRLVADGHSSKSIARELGISPLRVDKHVSDASRILGTTSRAESGRLLRYWEQRPKGSGDGQRLGAQSPVLSSSLDPRFNAPATDHERPEDDRTHVHDGSSAKAQGRILRSAIDDQSGLSKLAIWVSVAAAFIAFGGAAALLLAFDWLGYR